MDNQNPYYIRIKIGEDEFEFESPDKETFMDAGLKLLANTFGRYDLSKLNEETPDSND